MEGTGMFNRTITDLTNIIYQNTSVKIHNQVLSKAYSLGLPIRQDYSVERIVFTLSQVIINLVDQMVSTQKDQRLKRIKEKVLQGKQTIIEGYSTLNNSKNCMAGNLNIAAQIFSIFCPKMSIWDILDYISSIKAQLERQDAILENIRLQNRIFYLPNLRSKFNCHCTIFDQEPLHHQLLKCSYCSCLYHGQCQANIMFCNSCFMRFGIFDLKEEANDPFNFNKQVELCYFSYIENGYNYQHCSDYECVYFYIVKFDLPDLNTVQKKQKAIYLKLSLVDKIYSSQLELSLTNSRKKKEIKQFWDVDDIEYYFYLNHNQIKITSIISDYTIIFKLIPRILLPNNNILIIKSLKRNIKYTLPSPIQYWKEPQNNKSIIMLGVYQTNKIKGLQKINKQSKNHEKISKNVLSEIHYAQSIYYLQFTLKKINKIQYQIVDLIDIISKKKIVNPVRAYGCTHIECFDFQQYKHIIKPKYSKSKIIKKDKEVSIDVDEGQDQNNVIDLNSQSLQILQNVNIVPTQSTVQSPPLFISAEQRKRQFWRKRRQKQRRQKKQKDSLFCPICNKKMISLYSDPLFKQILSTSGFYNKVKIYNNGQFNFI